MVQQGKAHYPAHVKEGKKEEGWVDCDNYDDVKKASSPVPVPPTKSPPKPVDDEDLYKISPGILYVKIKRQSIMGGVLKNKDNCAAAPVPVSILWANKMNEVPNSSQAGTSKSGNNASSSSSSSKMTKATRPKKVVCLCAPTTHPGSFKCRHHRSIPSASKEALIPTEQSHSADQIKTGRLSSFGRPATATTHEDENPSESQ